MWSYNNVGEEFLSLLEKDSLTARDVAELEKALPHCDGELRQRMAEALFSAAPEDAWPLLWRLAGDEEWLVRAEVCQSLQNNAGREAIALLLDRVEHDPEELVRAYGIFSLGELLEELPSPQRETVTAALHRQEEGETAPRAKLALWEALYRAEGKELYLEKLLQVLESPDYTLRCFALNSLEVVLTQENREIIRPQILRLNERETTPAVRGTISRLLEEIGG